MHIFRIGMPKTQNGWFQMKCLFFFDLKLIECLTKWTDEWMNDGCKTQESFRMIFFIIFFLIQEFVYKRWCRQSKILNMNTCNEVGFERYITRYKNVHYKWISIEKKYERYCERLKIEINGKQIYEQRGTVSCWRSCFIDCSLFFL